MELDFATLVHGHYLHVDNVPIYCNILKIRKTCNIQKLSLCLTNYHAMKTYGHIREWRYSSKHS